MKHPITSKFLLSGFLISGFLIFPAGFAFGQAPQPAATPLNPDQTVLIGGLEQSLIPLAAAVTSARTAAATAAFAMPKNEQDLAAKLTALADAELALAMARAEGFQRIQQSANRISREQVSAAVAMTSRAGGRAAMVNPRGTGGTGAQQQAAQMVTGQGLAATLFASEPMTTNPISMDIDSRGRLWVTEGTNYRSVIYTRPEGDRVMILEDTNRDGVADKSTVFYQDRTINSALGIAVLDNNRAIVTCSPYVFLLTDTNGDDVADRRQVLFADNSPGNHDHGFHAFHFGPDGKLYFNFGNAVAELRRPVGGLLEVPLHGPVPAAEYETVVDIEGKQVKAVAATGGRGGAGPAANSAFIMKPSTAPMGSYRQGMAFRSNLDGTGVEVLGHNFRNNFEVAVDSFGRLWQSDNDDDGNQGVRVINIMRHGNYGYQDELTGAAWRDAWTAAGSPMPLRASYHWHEQDPGVAPTMLLTGAGSPTGITVYEGTLLPAAYQGQVMHTDGRPSVARAYPLTKNGAGFTARIDNILTAPAGDDWYRPSDIAVGPDGAIYIADWNDAVVGGHALVDQVLATDTGRIYRIAPPGNRPAIPALNLNTAAGAVAALQSPNPNTLYLAWTKLHSMGPAAESELAKLWQQPAMDDHGKRMRARALFLLTQIKGSEAKYLSQAIEDRDEDIRIAALNAAQVAGVDVIPYVRQVARDPSPMVRREAAIALYHNPSPAVPQIWATLAQQHDGKDRWYLEALGIGADGRWDEALAAWQTAVRNDVTSPAARDIIWRSRSDAKTPGLVASILAAPGATETDRKRFLRTLDYVKGPEKDAALLKLLTP